MPQNKAQALIPDEKIINKIYFIRGKKVMFDRDLAKLYGVSTKVLNQSIKRNFQRFPEDFMFQLDKKETDIFLRSQIVTLKKGRGQHIKYLPYVFTEQGVAMLSSVLKSKTAVNINIQIIRNFVRMREMIATHKELREKVEQLEKNQNKNFKIIFELIARLMKEDTRPKNEIGFKS